MTGHATPLRWWSAAKLRELAHAIEPGWHAFLDDWGLGMDRALLCRPAHALPDRMDAGWTRFAAHGSHSAWLHDMGSVRTRLATRLFGTRSLAVESMAQETADACWSAALDAVRRALKLPPSTEDRAPEAGLLRPWSGAVCLELPCGDAYVNVLVNAPAVGALLAPAVASAARRGATSMEPLLQAMSDRSMTLKVELRAFELGLGDLQDLQLGDIVPLQHALDRPLRVCLADGTPICDGYLGQRDGCKAIELVASGDQHEVKLKA